MGGFELVCGRRRPKVRGVGVFGAGLFLLSVSCAGLSREEAREALEEAQLYSQAASLIGGTLDLSENFSIGEALTASAENLRDFYASQLPCARTSAESNTVTVEYGVEGDDCEYRGVTFTGTHRVTVEVNDESQVEVHHEWAKLENGTIQVNGTADVTWMGGVDPSRRVVHDLSWKRLSDGREAEGRGNRVQEPLNGDLFEGFTVTGEAAFTGESGRYDLHISDVEMRWIDPVPQSGRYLLDTPFDESLTLEFTRSDARQVNIVVKGGRRQFQFEISTPR